MYINIFTLRNGKSHCKHTVCVPIHALDPTRDECLAPQLCRALRVTCLMLFIYLFEPTLREERTNGIQCHAPWQLSLVDRSILGIAPVRERGTRDHQMGRMPL